jgi:predicted transcriptional regulator
MNLNEMKGQGRGTKGEAPLITPWTTVSDALTLMLNRGQTASVVMDGERPVGVITVKALQEQTMRGTMELDAPVERAMDLEVVRVDHSSDLEDTLRIFRDAAWYSVRRRRPLANQQRSSS